VGAAVCAHLRKSPRSALPCMGEQRPQRGPRRRCRHAVAAVGPYVFVYGGLRGSALLDDFLLADDSSGAELSVCDPRSQAWCVRRRPTRRAVTMARRRPERRAAAARRRAWLDAAHGTAAAAEMLAAASAEEAAAAAALGVRRVGAVEDLRCLDEDLDSARCGARRGPVARLRLSCVVTSLAVPCIGGRDRGLPAAPGAARARGPAARAPARARRAA